MSSLVFVYGSLKRGGQLHHELEALEARFLAPAKIQGELYHVKGESWPGAFPAASQDYIHGELYKMPKPAASLKHLDRIERCEQGLFARKLVDAWAGNRKVKAWIYFFNHPEKRAARITSGNFALATAKGANGI